VKYVDPLGLFKCEPLVTKGTGELDNGWDMHKGGGEIGGRRYSEHSLERMAPDTIEVRAELSTWATQKAVEKGLSPGTKEFDTFVKKYVDPRGVPPMVVEDAIRNNPAKAGKYTDTFVHENDYVKVVTNGKGDVVTVIPK
jgi:hypothetical protein